MKYRGYSVPKRCGLTAARWIGLFLKYFALIVIGYAALFIWACTLL